MHPSLPPTLAAVKSAETDDNPNIRSKRMSPSDLSPRNLPLPPSPPFEYHSDNDDANDSDNASSSPLPTRPSRLSRADSDGDIPQKPIIHQQPLPFRPRNLSPSTPNARPHTSAGITMPPMQRAHSSPGVDSLGRFITPQYHHTYSTPRRPASPLSAGSRRRSPLRTAMEESYPSWAGLNIEPNIPEHAELDLSEDYSHLSPVPSFSATFPRSRRRPASPLHASASSPSLNFRTDVRAISPHTTGTTSPGGSGEKRYYVNEAYPSSFAYSYSSASSMPSTPSSLRSRSPSISSLETIEDSPDAEEAAMIAAEEDAKYKADDPTEMTDGRRRASLESRGTALRSNKERKRWSVCGAERRADFSLEVIEE